MDPLNTLPRVGICSICLNADQNQWKDLVPSTDQVKQEIQIIRQQVNVERQKKQNVAFNDGYCNPHTVALYSSYGMDPNQVKKSNIPCLIENTPEAEKLRQLYMRGIFTEQQIQQIQQAQKQSQQKLTERFQKLAGIIHS